MHRVLRGGQLIGRDHVGHDAPSVRAPLLLEIGGQECAFHFHNANPAAAIRPPGSTPRHKDQGGAESQKESERTSVRRCARCTTMSPTPTTAASTLARAKTSRESDRAEPKREQSRRRNESRTSPKAIQAGVHQVDDQEDGEEDKGTDGSNLEAIPLVEVGRHRDSARHDNGGQPITPGLGQQPTGHVAVGQLNETHHEKQWW